MTTDYKNLPNGGGFILDRPKTFDDLIEAFDQRYAVAKEKLGDDFSDEWITNWVRHWDEDQRTRARKYFFEAGRLICFVGIGGNEGYVVNVMLTPTYFSDGCPIDFMTMKCWTRETAQAVATSFNELILRME